MAWLIPVGEKTLFEIVFVRFCFSRSVGVFDFKGELQRDNIFSKSRNWVIKTWLYTLLLEETTREKAAAPNL